MAKGQTKKRATPPRGHPLMLDGLHWNQPAVLRHICDCLASSSNGLTKILEAGYSGLQLPAYTTIMEWLREDSELAAMYAAAKEAQADYEADKIMEIADEMPPMDGDGKRIDTGFVAWQRNRIDARKWIASKLKPKKYGDKLELGGETRHVVIVKDFTGRDGDD